jgi:very-short-patch-repair endonuclease
MVPYLQEPHRDLRIGEFARRQHGVVTLAQLQLAGLSTSAVGKRVRRGRLHRIHRGVYAIAPTRLTTHGRVIAAVLAYGDRAVASHRAAGGILGLGTGNRASVEVSVPVPAVRSRPGIDAHASPTLRPEDVIRRDGIPCTTVAGTLLDLADAVPLRQLERAVGQAERLRIFDLAAIEDVLACANGRRGAGVLRRLLDGIRDEPGLTESDLEERFLELVRDAGLPAPAVNEWVVVDDGPAIRADFLWRAQRLIVEVDGWASHGTRDGFERDRLRDQRVRLAGWDVLRFTHRQVFREGSRVMSTVGSLLAR